MMESPLCRFPREMWDPQMVAGTGGRGSSSLIPNEKNSNENPRSRRNGIRPELYSKPPLNVTFGFFAPHVSSQLPCDSFVVARGSTTFSTKSKTAAEEQMCENVGGAHGGWYINRNEETYSRSKSIEKILPLPGGTTSLALDTASTSVWKCCDDILSAMSANCPPKCIVLTFLDGGFEPGTNASGAADMRVFVLVVKPLLLELSAGNIKGCTLKELSCIPAKGLGTSEGFNLDPRLFIEGGLGLDLPCTDLACAVRVWEYFFSG
mmetsp:Transcript_15564/g.33715  ORF Transcript_15564/g.33715 Transcript_15564/m.33715 type:complete len:264 (+) Transcript_15564:1582-2373(+)